jgi:hypothetical protein
MRPLLPLAVALLLAGCIGADGSPSAAAHARAGSAGVTVELPPGWHSAQPSDLSPGQVTDPLNRVVVSSAPVTRRASGCHIADYAPPTDGVALVLVEWQRVDGQVPARPPRFDRRTLEIRTPPVIECFDGPGGSAEFRDHGRTFGAYLMLGRSADPALADQALSVLDTLRVEPRSVR